MISNRRRPLFGLTAALVVLCSLTIRTVRAGDTLPICHDGKVPQGIPRVGDYLSVYGMCYDPCAAGYQKTALAGEAVCLLKDCPAGFHEDPTGLTCLGRDVVFSPGEVASCDAGQEQILFLCFNSCPSGYSTHLGISCIKNCPSGYHVDDFLGLTCVRVLPPDVIVRDIRPRSSEELHCPSGMESLIDGADLWCFDQCGPDYTRVLFECLQDCPPGTTDVGLTCAKTLISRGAPTIPEVCLSRSFSAEVDTSGDPDEFTMLIMNDPQIGIWWEDGVRGGGVCADDDQCKYAENLESARLQVLAMNAVHTIRWPTSSALTHGGHGGELVARPRGVIINGDLTHNFNTEEYLDYERLFNKYSDSASLDALRWPLYPGIGNHEYANNIDGDQGGWWMGPYVLAFGLPDLSEAWYAVYGEKGCGYRAVDYMRGLIDCQTHEGFPLARLTSFDAGSLAYSWEIGHYHFVQLHNYPSFEHDRSTVVRTPEILDSISGAILDALEALHLLPLIPNSVLDAIPSEVPGLRITSSLDWLKDDVAAATTRGKRVVINLHDFGDHFSLDGEDYDLFIEAIERQNVVGVFAGHVTSPTSTLPNNALGYQGNVMHEVSSVSTEVRNGFGYIIPYFRGGHAGTTSRNFLLLADFAEDFYNVATLDTLTGSPEFFGSFDGKYTKTVPFNLNQPPTVSLVDGDLVLDEGSSHQFAFTFDDPNGDAVEFADPYPDCGGATLADEDIANGHFTCVFTDGPATFTVSVMLEDDAGFASEVSSVEVTVNNVVPTIDSIGPDRFIAEGETVALSPVGFSDPGIPDTHTATIDWGDGSPLDAGTVTKNLVSGGGEVAGSHTYGDNGTYVVTVTVTDDDGGSVSGTFTVEVTNLDPALTLDTSGATVFRAGPAFMGRIGVEQFHQASSVDPGSDDLRFVWTALEHVSGVLLDIEHTDYFNNGQSPDPFPSGPGTFPFGADDTAAANFARLGLYLLGVGVTDDDGGSAEAGLPKLIAGDAACPRSVGIWRHQFAESGRRRVEDVTLRGLLSYANFASSYFSEHLIARSIVQARSVLQHGGADLGDSARAKQSGGPSHSNGGGGRTPANMRGKAVQRVFVVWLNVASGALDVHEILPDGTTLLETLYDAEDILADPSTTHHDHILVMQRMKAINNRDCP